MFNNVLIVVIFCVRFQSTFSIVLEETSTNGSGDDLKIFKIIPDITSVWKVTVMTLQKHKKRSQICLYQLILY